MQWPPSTQISLRALASLPRPVSRANRIANIMPPLMLFLSTNSTNSTNSTDLGIHMVCLHKAHTQSNRIVTAVI